MSEPNAQQAAFWNDTAGRAWAEQQGALDRQLAPLGRLALAELNPRAGERVLDVGCGAGETSLELAAAVGPGGAVLGIDLSAPLLAVARRRAGRSGTVRFVEGDAQTHPFRAGAFDAAFSRFGVMFFADPAGAFANVRRALKPGGRLAFVCWRGPDENPFFTLPLRAAAPHLPAPPSPPDPTAPGPFAFADADRVRAVLAGAGFERVRVAPHDVAVSSGDLDVALALALRVGSLGRVLVEHPSLREVVAPSVRAALAAHDGSGGVVLDAAVWVVAADNDRRGEPS